MEAVLRKVVRIRVSVLSPGHAVIGGKCGVMAARFRGVVSNVVGLVDLAGDLAPRMKPYVI